MRVCLNEMEGTKQTTFSSLPMSPCMLQVQTDTNCSFFLSDGIVPLYHLHMYIRIPHHIQLSSSYTSLLTILQAIKILLHEQNFIFWCTSSRILLSNICNIKPLQFLVRTMKVIAITTMISAVRERHVTAGGQITFNL